MRGVLKRAGEKALCANWVDDAVAYGRMDICKLMVELGADFTRKVHDRSRDRDFTPLQRAMGLENEHLLKWLVEEQGIKPESD